MSGNGPEWGTSFRKFVEVKAVSAATARKTMNKGRTLRRRPAGRSGA